MRKRIGPLLLFASIALLAVGCTSDVDVFGEPSPETCPPARVSEGTACESQADCGPVGVCWLVRCVDFHCVTRNEPNETACFECDVEGSCNDGLCTAPVQ